MLPSEWGMHKQCVRRNTRSGNMIKPSETSSVYQMLYIPRILLPYHSAITFYINVRISEKILIRVNFQGAIDKELMYALYYFFFSKNDFFLLSGDVKQKNTRLQWTETHLVERYNGVVGMLGLVSSRDIRSFIPWELFSRVC